MNGSGSTSWHRCWSTTRARSSTRSGRTAGSWSASCPADAVRRHVDCRLPQARDRRVIACCRSITSSSPCAISTRRPPSARGARARLRARRRPPAMGNRQPDRPARRFALSRAACRRRSGGRRDDPSRAIAADLTAGGDRWFAICLATDASTSVAARVGLASSPARGRCPTAGRSRWRGAGIEAARTPGSRSSSRGTHRSCTRARPRRASVRRDRDRWLELGGDEARCTMARGRRATHAAGPASPACAPSAVADPGPSARLR